MRIAQILEERARSMSTAAALLAPRRTALDYATLHQQVLRISESLRRCGIRRDDVVAVVLPDGPEMAVAFLSVSATAICAPLNPAYQLSEFAFYLADLPARALMIASSIDSPARDAATDAGIPIIELMWSPTDHAGMFSLEDESAGDVPADYPGDDDDIALVLHTSGTTSRPKIVPLTHANLCASARHISSGLQLTSADRCLNVMPLFHIHGLVGALLSSLYSGGSVVCAPGFIGASFFGWLAEFRPTWYTAVPTMHRSVLSRAAAHRAETASAALRFIRSSSSALPRGTLEELEQTFGVPVIEAYGMTEAAHQMASNPLPPRVRKPGTVGTAAGPEIAVLDVDGHELPAGMRGEVCIRGPNVTSGYLRNAAANSAAFTDGWLRTGDEGVLDEEGYLTILGRLKELINRGGEKISPAEVDEALMAHPAVECALAFAAPDASLGEEVAAVVVLRPGLEVSERELREFVGLRLAHFKVPRRVIFARQIPLGPTGKPRRTGLASHFGISFDAFPKSAALVEHVAPRTPVEEILASIWTAVLPSMSPGVNDNFFYSGGDSALATQFVVRVRDTLSVDISLLSFFDNPTVAGMANVVEDALAIECVSATAPNSIDAAMRT